MAMRSLWTATLLLALTVSTCYGVPTYQHFLMTHVDFPRTQFSNNALYCQVMMIQHGINVHGTCKTINTFVHAPPTNLNTLCTNQPNWALHTTQQQFPVTVCNLIRRHPTCTYTSVNGLWANQFNHHVRVGCWGGLPVHLDNTFP
ncbi:angiogenin-like [Numida meleagris]|uniref:angiogenin-like n=1 Tax=Numida meleagris TaxID=8996 RepID=UPI000B3E0CF9|nr:angiogenin-like [Numida meleagris]